MLTIDKNNNLKYIDYLAAITSTRHYIIQAGYQLMPIHADLFYEILLDINITTTARVNKKKKPWTTVGTRTERTFVKHIESHLKIAKIAQPSIIAHLSEHP